MDHSQPLARPAVFICLQPNSIRFDVRAPDEALSCKFVHLSQARAYPKEIAGVRWTIVDMTVEQ